MLDYGCTGISYDFRAERMNLSRSGSVCKRDLPDTFPKVSRVAEDEFARDSWANVSARLTSGNW
jgi:hypothetical protein